MQNCKEKCKNAHGEASLVVGNYEEAFIMKEKLNNLEGAYIKLQEVQTLLNLIANDYFDIGNIDRNNPEHILKLTWEYKTYQTLLFIAMDLIYDQLQSMDKNIYGLYDDLRGTSHETI